MPIHRKKRKFEMGRQASMTKVGDKKVINVRGRGGNIKRRALKLNEGNFTWISEKVTKKCKILEVLYNATNNELVRTQTLVKNSIVSVDPTPFKYYWYIHYDAEDNGKKVKLPELPDQERKKKLEEKKQKLSKPHPNKEQLDKLNHFFELMNKGKLYACITSRPGQVGKADEFMMALQSLDNFRLSTYGLDNGGLFQKRQHMLQSEEEMNMAGGGSVGLIMQDGLSIRQRFCDIVNSIWGLGIWCDVSETASGSDKNMDGELSDQKDQSGSISGDQPQEVTNE